MLTNVTLALALWISSSTGWSSVKTGKISPLRNHPLPSHLVTGTSQWWLCPYSSLILIHPRKTWGPWTLLCAQQQMSASYDQESEPSPSFLVTPSRVYQPEAVAPDRHSEFMFLSLLILLFNSLHHLCSERHRMAGIAKSERVWESGLFYSSAKDSLPLHTTRLCLHVNISLLLPFSANIHMKNISINEWCQNPKKCAVYQQQL